MRTGSASLRPPPDPQALPQVLGKSALVERLNDILSVTPPGSERELHAFVDALGTAAQQVKAEHKNFKWQPTKIDAHHDLFRHLDLVTEHIMNLRPRAPPDPDFAEYLVRSLLLLLNDPSRKLQG